MNVNIKKVSLVFSCFNEEKCIDSAYNLLLNYLDEKYDYEILYIDDGSKDKTKDEILKIKNENKKSNVHITLISFSKNFGHEAAMLCGLDNATGDIAIFMDADGQHPFDKINEIIKAFYEGYDTISMQRLENKDQSFLGKIFSSSFYKFINKIANTDFVENASDFFAIDKKVIEILKKEYRTNVRFLRGIVQNLGFNKKIITYEAKHRLSGKSHYNFKKLFDLALDTICTYSYMPLNISLFIGFIDFILILLLILLKIVIKNFYISNFFILISTLILFMILFFIIYIVGRYISILSRNIKKDPIYIIDKIY